MATTHSPVHLFQCPQYPQRASVMTVPDFDSHICIPVLKAVLADARSRPDCDGQSYEDIWTVVLKGAMIPIKCANMSIAYGRVLRKKAGEEVMSVVYASSLAIIDKLTEALGVPFEEPWLMLRISILAC
ncbi:MAG: hypothetical protein CM15mP74_33920 [Halieaceae bacterium]|nr:MAG: hypothetical protein CM15mP74_33920 [Halieaceae bacterium]